MHIAFIVTSYPTKSNPDHGVFIDQFVRAIARSGEKCTIIQPIRIYDGLSGSLPPYYDKVDNNQSIVEVFRPRYISFSGIKLGIYNTAILTQWSYEWAVERVLNSLPGKPNVLYGHFLYPAGRAAVSLGKKLGLPAFVAVGESTSTDDKLLWSIKPFGSEKARNDFRFVCGVIATSTLLKKKLISQIGLSESRIGLFPNGVNLKEFFPYDKISMRNKYGFHLSQFIIAYVGQFDYRKGVMRLAAALNGQADECGVIYIGDGPLKPNNKNILFQGKVKHSQVAELLSAADIFVLPTLAEGSCNAILEALACGLPVITSSGEFNDDIVNDSVAIRIDPINVLEIQKSILFMREHQQIRQQMKTAALQNKKFYDIEERAKNVLQWIDKMR